jgi:hypothetical protein
MFRYYEIANFTHYLIKRVIILLAWVVFNLKLLHFASLITVYVEKMIINPVMHNIK